MNTLGERIKHVRKAKRLTLEHLANATGIRGASLSRLETGVTQSSKHILTIARALDVDPMWLQYGDGNAPDLSSYAQDKAAHNAHRYVLKAIKDGYLPRLPGQTCVDCGSPAKHYDHRDYNLPLVVEPVCFACNMKRGPALPFVHVNDR